MHLETTDTSSRPEGESAQLRLSHAGLMMAGSQAVLAVLAPRKIEPLCACLIHRRRCSGR
jgi:hypothetical protein